MRTQCPNEETLVDYLEGRLPGRQQSRVESHLAACFNCREQVGICLQLAYSDPDAPIAAAPKHLTDKAVGLVGGLTQNQFSRPLFQGVRCWAAKGVALLEKLAPSDGLQSIAVRGSGAVSSGRCISRKKKFKELTVTIEIERSSNDQALIRVVVAERPEPDHPVRVALFKGDREIASMILDDTSLVFDDISFGSYALVFNRSGVSIGEYRFEITADAGNPT